MFGILKKIAKVGLCGTAILAATAAATAAIAGEARTRAVVHEVQRTVADTIDEAIEDPQALRSQLREMEREYPAKIAQVHEDLTELRFEIKELERERTICQRVVTLVDGDLGTLQRGLASADAGSGNGPNALTSHGALRTGGYENGVSKVQARMQQLEGQRLHYLDRVNDADHNLVYMHQQESRLEDLLVKLEAERDEFQTQIAGLSRQIDAISRNDRLIGLLEKRNRTIEECSRYEAVSLDQITNRLSLIRARQEAALDTLVLAETGPNYEQEARMQIATESLRGQAEKAAPNTLKPADGKRLEQQAFWTAEGL